MAKNNKYDAFQTTSNDQIWFDQNDARNYQRYQVTIARSGLTDDEKALNFSTHRIIEAEYVITYYLYQFATNIDIESITSELCFDKDLYWAVVNEINNAIDKPLIQLFLFSFCLATLSNCNL